MRTLKAGAAALLCALLLRCGWSEGERVAALRARFSAALEGGDFEQAAGAAYEFSRLRASTLGAAATLAEMYPIGSSALYPLRSLRLSGDFVERRLFYRAAAESIAADRGSDGAKLLAAFDWTVRNIWPLERSGGLSGLAPREIALAGSGGDREAGWVFCTVVENLGLRAVLLDLKTAGVREPLHLAAANCLQHGDGWYVFDPGAGLPLTSDGNLNVATLEELFPYLQ